MLFIQINGSHTPLHHVSIEKHHQEAKKSVSWSSYFFYSSLLVALSPFTAFARISLLVKNFFERKDPGYANHQSYQTEDLIELTERIHDIVEPELKHMIIDIIAMERDCSHIHPILQGANVEIVGDGGSFFDSWKNNPKAKKRPSSHNCEKGQSYSVSGKLFNELLFWKDKTTQFTRFQFEANATHNPMTCVLHVRDYLDYKRSGLQQSQFGRSPFTESKPIRVVVDKEVFLENRIQLKKILKTVKNTKKS
jgi:hypothetical protein